MRSLNQPRNGFTILRDGSSQTFMAPLMEIGSLGDFGFERPVVLCHGTFDLLHPGHLDYLLEARELGATLICGVTADRWVSKGSGKPVFSEEDRAYQLRSLGFVDGVVVVDDASAIPLIQQLQPDFYAKGPDYAVGIDEQGNLELERKAVELAGGEVVFTSGRKLSSRGLHQFVEPKLVSERSSERSRLLSAFKRLSSAIAGKTVTVIGEPILDTFILCEPLGKTSKTSLLAFSEGPTRNLIGGSLAFAKHFIGLGIKVNLIHDSDVSRLIELEPSLSENINLIGVGAAKPRSIDKKRWIDNRSGQHVFEVYDFNDFRRNPNEIGEQSEVITSAIGPSDAVAFIDYGHGFLWGGTIAQLRSIFPNFPKVFANVQKNAGNEGYNPATKYSWVDHLLLNGSELESLMRQSGFSLDEIEPEIHESTGVKSIFVTQGSRGFAHYQSGLKPTRVPADKSIGGGDRTGAGDAAFAGIVALELAGLLEDETSLKLVNVFGQFLLSGQANEKTISTQNLEEFISENF